MDDARALGRRWVVVGSVSGVVAAASYLLLVATSPPDSLLLMMIAAYSLGIALSGVGLGVLLRLHRPSVGAWLAPRLLMAGGAIMALMLVVQQTMMGYMGRYIAGAADDAQRQTLLAVNRGLSTVHLGMDVAWDIFLLAATALFAFQMLRHPRFGAVWGGAGLLLVIVMILFEMWAFPISPYEQGAPYILGPALATWHLAVHLRALWSLGWVEAQVQQADSNALRVSP